MQLKFDSSLKYQIDAINSVVGLFNGQELRQTKFELKPSYYNNVHDEVTANNLTISDDCLLENLQLVQKAQELDISSALLERQFSIEMETGTGKTYVYLRSIFELNKQYGFQKFIIVVPSVAIREGIANSIKTMKTHFDTIYNNVPCSAFVYDSSKLSNVREFAIGNQIKIMIINIQSFQKDVKDSDAVELTDKDYKKLNVINRENDKMQGRKPIEYIKATNPIVIIDEPQSVDNTDKAKAALARLKPLVTLRFSATHRDSQNLIYSLDPVKAYEQELVKRIEVASVCEHNNFNDPYIKLLKVDNKKGIKAEIELHEKTATGVKSIQLWIKHGDNLYIRSKNHLPYNNGFVVRNIDCTPNSEYIEFDNSKILGLNQEIGAMTDDGSLADQIMKEQIRVTIAQHLDKERMLHAHNIKVLSLFFIDKVSSYRVYSKETSNTTLGKIGKWFEELYNEEYKSFIQRKPNTLEHLKDFKVGQLHNGYFSQDNKKNPKDTNGATKDDENTYHLIMSDKERLLDPANPLRFIFSHTALREGWDNPNVFQVCILREVGSEITRRQQIGRGLRLPVNANGERIHDSSINRLTIVANESYEDFAAKLQQEFEDAGIKFNKEHIKNERNKQRLVLNKQVVLSDDFKNLWEKIKQRTRYKVKFKTDDLIKKAVQEIQKVISSIQSPSINTTLHQIGLSLTGIESYALRTGEGTQKKIEISNRILPDILSYLEEKTALARHTLRTILVQSNSYDAFSLNPQAFMQMASTQIQVALHSLMLDGIKYEKIDNHYWDMSLVNQYAEQEITRYVDNLYKVNNQDKSLLDYIECDSNIEKNFAKELDYHEAIKMFFKLPNWFVIQTPIGKYNPDWAFVVERVSADNNSYVRLYLVCETKSDTESNALRGAETEKINCGTKHFATLDVTYKVTTRLSETLLKLEL